MAYSRWRDSYWYTSALTGSPHIDDSVLFINPKEGTGRQFTYGQLKAAELDRNWVAMTFPEAPERWLAELLRYVSAFMDDMKDNVYRYHGCKEPITTVGAAHERVEEVRHFRDQRNGGTKRFGNP